MFLHQRNHQPLGKSLFDVRGSQMKTSCRELKKLWKRYSKLVGSDQSEKVIDEENELIGEIEEKLPFKDEEEHQRWLDILFTYKFWEDFEEMTLMIIERR